MLRYALRHTRRTSIYRGIQVNIWCLTGTLHIYACSQANLHARYGALRGVTPLSVGPGAVLRGVVTLRLHALEVYRHKQGYADAYLVPNRYYAYIYMWPGWYTCTLRGFTGRYALSSQAWSCTRGGVTLRPDTLEAYQYIKGHVG